MLTIISLTQSVTKSEQDLTAARKMHNRNSSFKNVLDGLINGSDQSVFGAAIKAALSIDEEIVLFTKDSGEKHFINNSNDKAPLFFTNDSRQNYVENYSKIFAVKGSHNEDQQYVLRNGNDNDKNKPQVELLRFAKIEGTIEEIIQDAKVVAICPNITLSDLRNAISSHS